MAHTVSLRRRNYGYNLRLLQWQSGSVHPETGQAEPIGDGTHQRLLPDGTVIVHDHKQNREYDREQNHE